MLNQGFLIDPFSEIAGPELLFNDMPVGGGDPVGGGIVAGCDDFVQLGAGEDQRRTVVSGEAGRQGALRDEPVVRRATLGFAVVVRTSTSLQQAEALG